MSDGSGVVEIRSALFGVSGMSDEQWEALLAWERGSGRWAMYKTLPGSWVKVQGGWMRKVEEGEKPSE